MTPAQRQRTIRRAARITSILLVIDVISIAAHRPWPVVVGSSLVAITVRLAIGAWLDRRPQAEQGSAASGRRPGRHT
ncbi:hypothetical protein [Streptacidiphilus carbonis]|uniref:hypothetical protein n=1 Tax=Streptacidiphilus carbonis TaxID=105422 RepID=UPI001269F1A4|nr:hypothetical protein [Streptacidiphilus carbonis]